MTRLLDIAIEAATQLPPERQDQIARAILDAVEGVEDEIIALSEADRAAVRTSRRHAERGDFASETEVESVLAKFR